MSGNEPPEDPSEAPTGYYDYGSQEEGEEGDPERSGPWYRRPIIFLTVAFVAVFLLGIALYYFADQTKGTGGTRQTPTSPTSPTTSAPAPTTSSGVSTTTEPATPTETTAPPSTTEATTTAPTTTSDEGHHHHHHHDGGTP